MSKFFSMNLVFLKDVRIFCCCMQFARCYSVPAAIECGQVTSFVCFKAELWISGACISHSRSGSLCADCSLMDLVDARSLIANRSRNDASQFKKIFFLSQNTFLNWILSCAN